MRTRVLVARLDSDGDVLVSGPAVRAAAAGRGLPADVTVLCGPNGRQAADLLPGVARVLEWRCPWIVADPPPVNAPEVLDFVTLLAEQQFDVALVLTSFHQSPLPLALLLRLAGVPEIAAISVDYPGSLLDHRVGDDDRPEPERALLVAQAAGFALPPDDDGALRIVEPVPAKQSEPHVVVHPGAAVPARAWSPERCAEAVVALRAEGWQVLVTGGPREKDLTARVAGDAGVDLGGRTSYRELAGVLAGAAAVVVGNTGPAHLAAAVGTPVVSLFAPVVSAVRWAPYRVPHIVLGDQNAACRDSRARECPVPGHPCLNSVHANEVVAAVTRLAGGPDAQRAGVARTRLVDERVRPGRPPLLAADR
ncbi:glycosyltransferase family 9 protein [Actinocrispum sp. NPDC049592]|uniref:glycosyltransferase family 9 protein n=1 Tax=Actinocrispum sp. NPDC049592 TaxID=3154835 RepID=UPI0034355BE4